MATGGANVAEDVELSHKKGFPKEVLVDPSIDLKYLCVLCECLLRRPIQSYCGHRFCSLCIQAFLQRETDTTCPACIKEDIKGENSLLQQEHTFPDNAINRELIKKSARCINSGCDWQGKLQDYSKHEDDCEYQMVLCECGQQILRSGLEKHHEKECVRRIQKCPLCHVILENNEGHLSENEMEIHIKANSESHLWLLTKHLQKLNLLKANTNANTNEHSGQISSNLAREIEEKVKVSNDKTASLETVISILNQQMLASRHEAMQQNSEKEELKRQVAQLKQQVELRDRKIEACEKHIEDFRLTSYEGVFTWKITNFSSKQQQAANGSAPSLYSSPFYTDRAGYKLCVRVYPYGDGMGKGTHLSVFLVLMKGEFDSILNWPFRRRVTLMLLDQNNREHIIDGFRPDANSSSFKKPTSESNIASGCPMFCELPRLAGTSPAYVKDNSVFIRIIIDKEDC